MKLFETSKNLKRKLTEATKDVELPNSNLYLLGGGKDVNGNSIIKFFFPNQRAFSLQVNGETLKKSQDILRSNDKLDKISQKDLEVIAKEATDYIKKYGSSQQKSSLKTYGKLKEAVGDVGKEYQGIQEQINDLYSKLEKETNSLLDKRDSEIRKNEMERMSIFQDALSGNDFSERAKLRKKYSDLADKMTTVSDDYNNKIEKVRSEIQTKIDALRKKQIELFNK
jgi:hypothetical protein